MSSSSRRHFLAAGTALPLAAAARSRPVAPAPRGLLEGKVAVIYGAAGVIGSGVSRAFAAIAAHARRGGSRGRCGADGLGPRARSPPR